VRSPCGDHAFLAFSRRGSVDPFRRALAALSVRSWPRLRDVGFSRDRGGFFEDPWFCPRDRFIFGPSRGRSLRSPDGLALEDAFVVSRPGFHQAPLMGFSKTAPPSTHARDVHSCVRTSRLPVRFSRFGLPLPGTGPVPPSRFLTALTGYSVAHAAGLLHPAADHGVHRVQRPSKPRGLGEQPPRCLTLRRVSLASSHPLSPGSCPLIVRHPRMARSRGLAPLVESVASSSCCHAKEPDPPLGLSSYISRPSHPSAWVGVPKDLGFALGARFARGARSPGTPLERSLGFSRSSSQSNRPGVWTGSAGLSAGGVYGLGQARSGFEWLVPREEVSLRPSRGGV
jgi:hypothetical protein